MADDATAAEKKQQRKQQKKIQLKQIARAVFSADNVPRMLGLAALGFVGGLGSYCVQHSLTRDAKVDKKAARDLLGGGIDALIKETDLLDELMEIKHALDMNSTGDSDEFGRAIDLLNLLARIHQQSTDGDVIPGGPVTARRIVDEVQDCLECISNDVFHEAEVKSAVCEKCEEVQESAILLCNNIDILHSQNLANSFL